MSVIKNIIFDFDGVILNSVPVKTEAFRKLFLGFDESKVDKLIAYHEENGGISRYEKIKYFFNVLMEQEITENEVEMYALKYSQLTKEELCSHRYIIEDTIHFIRNNHKQYNMHIASGADEKDLKYICEQQHISSFFVTINGSPTKKDKIVENILKNNSYMHNETILIGDSINDYEAARVNQIDFYGYNNLLLVKQFKYINSLDSYNLK